MTQIVENHVLNRYKLLKKVGSGAYGHVWKVQQIKTDKILALKKIFDAFQHSTDSQRTYRQIILLHQIDHQNIVKLHRVIKAQNDKDLYLVFQFMQADLHNAIGQKILKDLHNRYIVYQLVRGIQYLHEANIIHRDLKPSNLLINSDCSLKICDLGLARTIESRDSQQEQIFTEEVATRWYRAPQVLLGSQSYGKAADVWSIGCILAQMLTGKPFFPGNSTLNQLQRIVTFTGKPSKYDIQSIQSPLAESMLESIGKINQKRLSQFFKPQINQEAIDLVLKTIHFNPHKRLTAQQILHHPYIRQFSKSNHIENVKKIYLDISQNKKKSVKQYKRLIYEWIVKTYKDEAENQFIKNSMTKETNNSRAPLRQSVNQFVKKSYSAKHSSSGTSSFIKETPTYSKKKITQTSKMLGSPASSSVKKLFRCSSQKPQKYGVVKQDFLQSPLSTTYKQFKALKQSLFSSTKNISTKKSSSLMGSMKQKNQKGSVTSILSKFTKPVSTQPNFGGTGKYSSVMGKSYL